MNTKLFIVPRANASRESVKCNATKTGLTGKQIAISGEDPAVYDALRSELLAEYAPESEIEAMLVEQVAQNLWRIRRAKTIEREVLDKYGPLQCITDPQARKVLSRNTRYLTGFEKSWRNASRELEKIRRKKGPAKPPMPPLFGA